MKRNDLASGRHCYLPEVLTPKALDDLREVVGKHEQAGQRIEESAPLFSSDGANQLTARIQSIWPGMRPVRMVSFNKNVVSNWTVPWHQDHIIAVQDKSPVPGFSNWTRKGSVWHCEAPVHILRKMLFVRLHLDDTTPEDGAMQIAVGSARHERIPAGKAEAIARACPTETPCCNAGSAVVLPMLTLHRSSPTRTERPRRVLRVDFAATDLPKPLGWRA